VFDTVAKALGGIGLPWLAGKVLGDDAESFVKRIATRLGLRADSPPSDIVTALQTNPEAAIKLREIELEETRAYLGDVANLRGLAKAELQSEDPVVRRARPAWLWGLLGIIVINYGFIPVVMLIFAIWGKVVTPYVLPEQFWTATIASFLGYGAMRSVDKVGKMPWGNRT